MHITDFLKYEKSCYNVVKTKKTPQPLYTTISSLNLCLVVLICLEEFEITSI